MSSTTPGHNAGLMRMMEDVHTVENRGSGIKTMLHALREANLEPPRFDDKRAAFWVTFHNHTLLSPEAVRWLNQHAHRPLNDRQRLALVYVRQRERITNGDYRRLNHVDPLVAGQELRGLVEQDLIDQQGVGRWTYYTMRSEEGAEPSNGSLTDEEVRVLDFVREHGSITNSECRDLLASDLHHGSYLLKRLTRRGVLRRDGERRWARYRLP